MTDPRTPTPQRRLDAVTAVIQGKAACCPDCSTLSVGERNTIRSVVATLTVPNEGE